LRASADKGISLMNPDLFDRENARTNAASLRLPRHARSTAWGNTALPNDSTEETETILLALAQAVEQRDPHTARHCERLASISIVLGTALDLPRESLRALYRGGFLHDVGKVGIPDAILFKPTSLTSEEWLVMRTHTIRGEEICRHVQSLAPVLPIIRHHHERWDGSGYPDGLRGAQIPILARVLQIADIYDALISPRPYKRALTAAEALKVIEKETEFGWRDPQIVNLFFRLHGGVISRIDEACSESGEPLEAMRAAIGAPCEVLNESELRTLPLNGHTSFRRPQSAPASDSPWGEAGT
jgi:putative two-component system response regulator